MMATSTTASKTKSRASQPLRRVGYGISIVIHLVLIWVVNNLLDWDLVPFLTEDFELLAPVVIFSLIVGVVINIVYFIQDPRWLRMAGDIVVSAVALIVIVRTYQVFPFEISAGFWTGATRVILIFTGVVVTIGVIANSIQLATGKWATED